MNNLAKLLKKAKTSGVEQGLYVMEQTCLIALDNVVRMWDLPVDDSFFKDVEKEMKEVYEDIVNSVPNGDVEEMAEKISFYVDEIRERRKMDEEDR